MKFQILLFSVVCLLMVTGILAVVNATTPDINEGTITVTYCREGLTVVESMPVPAPLSSQQVYEDKVNVLSREGWSIGPCETGFLK